MAASSPNASSVIDCLSATRPSTSARTSRESDRKALRRPAVLCFAQGLPDEGDDVGVELRGEPGSLDVRGMPGPAATRRDLVDEDSCAIYGDASHPAGRAPAGGVEVVEPEARPCDRWPEVAQDPEDRQAGNDGKQHPVHGAQVATPHGGS